MSDYDAEIADWAYWRDEQAQPRKTITCNRCHKDGLHWEELATGWRPHEPDGSLHICSLPLTELVKSDTIQSTHYAGCWREHGACAITRLKELEIFLSMCNSKKIDTKEIRKVIG